MTQRWWSIAVVWLVVGGTAARADEPPPPVVTLRTTEYELADAADRGSLAIRFAPAAGIEPKDLRVRVVDAAVGNRHETGLAGAFTPTLGSDATGAMIELAIDFARVNRAATYTVMLELSDGASAARAKPVTATLVLKHPAAKLRAVPETIVIEREGWLPGGGKWDFPAVELEETTGASRVTSLAVRDLQTARNDGAPVGAKLRLEAPAAITGGAHPAVAIAIDGQAPGGVTAQGSIELRAPQLAEPVTVKYELRSHVHAGTVALVLILGLGLGLGVKSALRRIPERMRVRRELVAIAKEARDLGAASKDGPFRERCEGIEAKCLEGRKASEAARPTVRDTQRKALDSAIADLASRLAAAQGKIGTLEKLVETPWRVPPVVAELLAVLRTTIARARGQAELGDAAGAELIVAEVLEAPGGAKDRLAVWRSELAGLITRLDASPELAATPWPESAAAVARETARRLRELLAAVGAIPPADTPSLASWLANVHALQMHLDDSAARLDTTWSLAITAAAAELSALSPNPLADLAAALPARGGDAQDYLSRIADSGGAVVAAFRGRLLEQVPDGAPDRKELESLISQGKWSRAAALARRAIASASQGPVLGSPPQQLRTSEPAAPAGAVSLGIPGLAAPTPEPRIIDLGALLKRTERAEAITVWVTSAISFGLIVVLYLLHYQPKKVGTWQELIAIFGQAFVLDLGVDTVVQGARSLIK